jgi:hypothetical protein
LEVELGTEAPARLEVRLGVSLQALDDTLRLGVVGLEEVPADAQLAAEGGEGIGRAPVPRMERALPVPNERVGQAAEQGEAAGDPIQEVGCLLEKTSVPAPARE